MINNTVKVNEKVIKNDIYYKQSLVLTYTIKYPEFSSRVFKDSINKINKYYENSALEYEMYCRQDLYKMAVEQYEYSIENGFPVQKYEAYVTYNITYNKSCTLSLYFDRYEYKGGAHGITMRYSDTWNLKNADRIPLSNLFPPGFNYRAYIFFSIIRQIDEQIKDGQNLYFENYRSLVAQNFNPDNFFLTPKGINIFYQQYDIAPYASGIPVFTIYYSNRAAMQPKCL